MVSIRSSPRQSVDQRIGVERQREGIAGSLLPENFREDEIGARTVLRKSCRRSAPTAARNSGGDEHEPSPAAAARQCHARRCRLWHRRAAAPAPEKIEREVVDVGNGLPISAQAAQLFVKLGDATGAEGRPLLVSITLSGLVQRHGDCPAGSVPADLRNSKRMDIASLPASRTMFASSPLSVRTRFSPLERRLIAVAADQQALRAAPPSPSVLPFQELPGNLSRGQEPVPSFRPGNECPPGRRSFSAERCGIGEDDDPLPAVGVGQAFPPHR